MVRRRYGLPTLNALAAFEAAARNQNLSPAAEEVNVTAGAVSKQLRLLEEDIGRRLFHRGSHGISLTPEGVTLARALSKGFETMSEAVRQLRLPDVQSSVTISTTMAIMQMWLMPRLGSFWSALQTAVAHIRVSCWLKFERCSGGVRVQHADACGNPCRGELYLARGRLVRGGTFLRIFQVCGGL